MWRIEYWRFHNGRLPAIGNNGVWARTKIRHLVALRIKLTDAIKAGMSSKGSYCMSRTKVTQMAMSNRVVKTARLRSRSKITGPVFITCFNRLVRTRMLGGVGRAGAIPALTRLARNFALPSFSSSPLLCRTARNESGPGGSLCRCSGATRPRTAGTRTRPDSSARC